MADEVEPVTDVKNQAESAEAEVISFGKAQPVKFDINAYAGADVLPDSEEKKETTSQAGAEASTAKEGEGKSTSPAPDELSEAQLKAYFEKQGIAFESIDALKEKLSPKEIISPEEKKRQELAAEKKLVDLFVEGGGTVEQYVAIKNIAEKPVAELSLETVRAEYKELGFTDEQINTIIKERYYQISDEDLENFEDEDDKELTKKLKEVFSQKLENKASYKQKQAQKILADLKQAADSDRLAAEQEEQLSSKIDEYFKKVPRKLTFQIGESNGNAISPIEYEVSESDIAEVQGLLKDSKKRQQFLTTEDGSLNYTKLSEVLLRNKYLESLVKAAYHTGGSRQAEIVDNIFARNPYDVGVGGAPEKNKFVKGQVASFGKVQRVSPQHSN